jgi:hypothetical protein
VNHLPGFASAMDWRFGETVFPPKDIVTCSCRDSNDWNNRHNAQDLKYLAANLDAIQGYWAYFPRKKQPEAARIYSFAISERIIGMKVFDGSQHAQLPLGKLVAT